MQEDDNQYIAGKRNIGKREVTVRKKVLYFFLFTTLLASLWSYEYCGSLLCWAIMMVSSFAASVLFFEVRYKFCILFGFFNLYNFGLLGNLNEVAKKEDGLKDRKKLTQIILLSLFIATGYSSLVHWVSLFTK